MLKILPTSLFANSVLSLLLLLAPGLTAVPFRGVLLRITRQGLTDTGMPLLAWVVGPHLLGP
jgi:hypothetical protein